MMLCIHYRGRERALSILASWWQSQWAGHHHHHQPGAGSGEHIALPLVDAVTSAASWWWQRQSRAWWFVIRVKHVEVSQHNAFTYFVARGFHPVGSDQRAYVIRHSVPAAGGRALHQVHPVHSSQQKELKSISSAKVMCSCSWVNKNGNDFITIISSSRWWKWKVSPVCAVSGLTKPRESSRRPENRREAQRSLEKPWENPRRPEKPLEASRRTKETRESSTGGFSGHFEFREGSLSALLFVCLPPAPQKIMVEMLRNHTEVKPGAFSTLLDFTLLLPQFSFKYLLLLLSSIGYNIHLHYMIFFALHWTLKSGYVE